MKNQSRHIVGALRGGELAQIALFVAIVAGGCTSESVTPSGTGGLGSGGTVSGGGSGTGGASSTGGSASGGGLVAAGSGGTGGSAAGSVGTGGSVGGSGGTGTGGSAGAAGGPAVGKSSGCGKASTMTFKAVPNQDANAAPGSGNTVGTGEGGYVTIPSSGKNRDFAMRLPDNYDNNQPYPLIFVFHPQGGNGSGVDNGGSNGYLMAYYGFQKLSNNGAIFVAPTGLGGNWANDQDEDTIFVDDMVKLIEENYCVDTKKLFASGFSYGGGMSYALACARADVFRGVAIYGGGVLSGCDGGTDPIAYMSIHGFEDGRLPIEGARDMRDRFVTNNGCTPQNPPEPPEGPPYLNPGGHICTDYEGCQSGYPVRWCAHQSGHGNAIVDGNNSVYNECGTPPQTCSTACPCSWVPEATWSFWNAL